MRVLHAIPALGGGGAERQLALLAPALGQQGADVHVVFQHDGEHGVMLARGGVTLHPLRLRGHRDPRLLHRLHGIVRRVRPDVIHTWLPVMDAMAGAVAIGTHTPWVLSERSVADAYERPSISMRLRSALAGRAAGVIGNSPAGLALWRDLFPESRRFLVPNALPLDEIAAAGRLDRTRLPVDPEAPLLVYAGRFSAEKNIRILIDALCEVCADRAVALLCGDGPERPDAEATVRERGLDARIRFTGYRQDLWSIFKAADVVVSVSRFEGSPNVVLEAAACGVPLLLSDIPAHRSLLGTDAADYVACDDAESVADTLRRMLGDPDHCARRAEVARSRIGDRAPATSAVALLTAYRAVLDRAPLPVGVAAC